MTLAVCILCIYMYLYVKNMQKYARYVNMPEKVICWIYKNMHYPCCWWLTPDEYPKGSLELQQSRSPPVWCHGWATSEEWLGISSSKACETDNKQLQALLISFKFQFLGLFIFKFLDCTLHRHLKVTTWRVGYCSS